jgi:hypothetical protein
MKLVHGGAATARIPMGLVVLALAAAALAAIFASVDWRDLLGADTAVPAAASRPVSRSEQQALIAATHGPAAVQGLTGESAVAANAALPFSTAPILAASGFSIARAAAGDQERALLCMTQAIYYEAGFEPIEGRRAVAQVVLNRMRHPAFPKTVCGVVYDGSNQRVCQFSFTCDGSLARAPGVAAWRAARAVAQAALAGAVDKAVGTATHYHADYVSPYWAPKLTKLAQVGAHIFYRWPGSWGLPGAFSGRYAGMEAIPAPTALAVDADVPPEVAAILAKMPPERRAENDVGGRLDVTKGWSLNIPMPTETRGAYAAATSGQDVKMTSGPAPAAQVAFAERAQPEAAAKLASQ